MTTNPTTPPDRRDKARMKLPIVEVCISLASLALAKAFALQLAEISWLSFLAICLSALAGCYLGTRFVNRSRER